MYEFLNSLFMWSLHIASLSFLIAWRSQGTWTSYMAAGRERAEAAGTFIAWTQKSWNISSSHAISQSNYNSSPGLAGRGKGLHILMEHVHTGRRVTVGSCAEGRLPQWESTHSLHATGLMGGTRLFTHSALPTRPPTVTPSPLTLTCEGREVGGLILHPDDP